MLNTAQLGEFALKPPTQGDVYAVFVSLRRLQRDLAQPERVNTLLLASTAFPTDTVTLEDLGIKVRALPGRDALSVESNSAVISDPLADKVREVAGASAHPILSYLANSIRIGDREIPYSLVAAIDQPWQPESIYLNDWAAKDLNAKTGDPVTLEYYYWEPSGSLVTRTAAFHLEGILPMSGMAVDRDLTPDYPGITEAPTMSGWDPPFPIDLKRVRPRDEDYWKKYRTPQSVHRARSRTEVVGVAIRQDDVHPNRGNFRRRGVFKAAEGPGRSRAAGNGGIRAPDAGTGIGSGVH